MTVRRALRILLVAPDLSENSLGRAYALWLLIKQLGWTATVVSVRGREIWAPLRSGAFADCCRLIPDGPDQQQQLADLSRAVDLMIAVKPRPESMQRVLELAERTGTRYLVDLDDPDFDGPLSVGRPVRQVAKFMIKHRQMQDLLRMRRLYRTVPAERRIVSNPVLQARYGGTVIPHVRAVIAPGAEHSSRKPSVCFVGTARRHKGIGLLREAVAALADRGYRLVITDDAPGDAQSWEDWVGPTSMSAGLQLVAGSDIVVLPSADDPFSRGQLPVKLVDAMMLGRAIAVSDVEPMPWALAGSGRVLPEASATAVTAVLAEFADPALRRQLGRRARQRFLDRFSVEANTEIFAAVCLRAVDRVAV